MKYIVFFVLVIFVACNPNNSEVGELTQKELLDEFVSNHYSEYRLVDSTFMILAYSPYTRITDRFIEPNPTEVPHLFSYDLNSDGDNEYIFQIFKTYALENSESSYDSVFESKTILVSHEGNNLKVIKDDFGYRGSVFNDSYPRSIRSKLLVALAGEYARGYPFSDTVYVEGVALGGYSSYSVGLTFLTKEDSLFSIPMYLD
eukprot:m.34529 g.34529  ORF g.34529 m.34529 type:complete len:202 (-) comp8745_c0_seq1:1189-1794(-)